MDITRSHIRFGIRWSWPLLMALGVGVLLLLNLGGQSLEDPDIVMHITTGKWMFEHMTVPLTDPFSYTRRGAPWVAHEWLAQCFMALLVIGGSWTALVLVTVGLFVWTLAYLMRFLLDRMPVIYALLMTALAAAAMAPHLLSRPHVMAWPLLVVWMAELVKANESRRPAPWWLLGIMVVWANLHGSFTLGLFLIAPMALEAVWQAPSAQRIEVARRWVVFGVLALIASMCTPYGWRGLWLTVELTQLNHLQRINEWMHPGGVALLPLELWLLMAVMLAMLGYLRLSVLRFVLLAFLLHQALMVGRLISVFGMLAPILIATAFGERYAQMTRSEKPSGLDGWFDRLKAPADMTAVFITGVLLILTAGLMHPTYTTPSKQNLAPALRAVHIAGVQGHVLNAFNLGAPLIQQGVPVFIDGRADLYGDAHLSVYFDLMESNDPTHIAQQLDRLDIAWTALLPKSHLLLYLNQSSEWRKLYEDEGVVVHVRSASKNQADTRQQTLQIN